MQLYIKPEAAEKCPKDYAVINVKEEPQYTIGAGPSIITPELLFENKDKSVSYCFRRLTSIGNPEYQFLRRSKFRKKYTPISYHCFMSVRKPKKGPLIFLCPDRRYVYSLSGNAAELKFTLEHNGNALGSVKKDKVKFQVKHKVKDKDTGEEKEEIKEEEKEAYILETATDEGMPFFAAAVAFIDHICHSTF